MKKQITSLLCLLFSFYSFSQGALPQVEVLTQGEATNLRGLSVVNDIVIWVSGSNGMVGKSTDGGKSWKWRVIKGFENNDFRDIEAFDANTAVIMAIGEPAYLLKTTDGGDSWKVVYENKSKGMFLDAMEFWNEQSGIVIGDPIKGKVFVARTFDGGNTWREIPEHYKPAADSGEAFFAASGTSVRALDRDESVLVSGGLRSHIYIRNQRIPLPIAQGSDSKGAFSVSVLDHNKLKGGKTIIVVGGDYQHPASDSLNCFYTHDRGQTWKAPVRPPHGFKSCVEFLSKTHVIACGPTGADYSFDGGKTWKPISKEGFHVCRIAKSGATTFLAGADGKIGKVVYPGKKD